MLQLVTYEGMKLMKLRIEGIREVKKINRRELKVIFIDKKSANTFLIGPTPEVMQVKAFIPMYNIRKTGIVFDIPLEYEEGQLLDIIDSKLPIVNVFRCKKRKFVDRKKSKEWIPARTIRIVFRGQVLPDEISFGYSKRKVKPSVPNVIQCFNCQRFGHLSKFCRQENPTCLHCGIQHENPAFRNNQQSQQQCFRPMKCFHCHSGEHDANFKECSEFLRNQLIKEAMYFQNLTFFEANDEFPRTQSKFRLAELETKSQFPHLPQRRLREERVEESFPRKTASDLSKQYGDYLLLNQGKKPSSSSNAGAQSYSAITKKPAKSIVPSEPTAGSTPKISGGKQASSKPNDMQLIPTLSGTALGDKSSEAIKFIDDLQLNLSSSYTDSSQPSSSTIDNDLLLIEIGNMVQDFLIVQKRGRVVYENPTKPKFL